MNRQNIFVGSSVEGLDVAYAIQQNLESFAEVTVWNQGIFQISSSIFSDLINAIQTFDFAIFVFSPSDIINIRGVISNTVRDNVVFETGLFVGHLGIDKVYFIKPKGHESIHLPSDLLGLVYGEYDTNRMDKNLRAATGPFCHEVKARISKNLVYQKRTEIESRTNNYIDHPDFNSGFSITNMEKDLNLLRVYMRSKKWKAMSFERIQNNVNPRFTENYLMKIVEEFPEQISRCKLSEGKYGVKLLEIDDK